MRFLVGPRLCALPSPEGEGSHHVPPPRGSLRACTAKLRGEASAETRPWCASHHGRYLCTEPGGSTPGGVSNGDDPLSRGQWPCQAV